MSDRDRALRDRLDDAIRGVNMYAGSVELVIADPTELRRELVKAVQTWESEEWAPDPVRPEDIPDGQVAAAVEVWNRTHENHLTHEDAARAIIAAALGWKAAK